MSSLCPNCQSPFESGFSCLSCGGILAGLAIFNQVCSPGFLQKTLAFVREHGVESARGCPSCRNQMKLVKLPLESSNIELDFCLHCQSVWFDPGELQQLPRMTQAEKDEAERVRLQIRQARLAADSIADLERQVALYRALWMMSIG